MGHHVVDSHAPILTFESSMRAYGMGWRIQSTYENAHHRQASECDAVSVALVLELKMLNSAQQALRGVVR